MPVDRPTFSESWYRVAELRPRLRATVRVHRQHFRGRMWYVIQDPASNLFFRVNDAAYRFVGLLDGRRTVAEVWRICNEQIGDAAPTQGEAIQLLGQLYTSNLLRADLPPDTAGLFRRYRKRVTREVQGYLMNLLFIRIPLLDPDHFLNRWVGVFGLVFTKVGFALWLGLLGAGLYAIAGRGGDLIDRASGILDLANLPWLYVALIIIKVCHEFGHAFACKKFGRAGGTGGEVHVMGVMFLVFTPLPYVDASSAWAFRRKRHRVIVGTSGMMVELAVAAIAALIWSRTAQGTPLHAVTYNMMFIASVSSLLFNGNPLLRFDGYYILSDLLEMPNLAQRSKQYIYYVVKRYVWRVRRPHNPAHTPGEKAWLPSYGLASTAYRIVICVGILLFIAGKLFFVGVILALMAVSAWVLVPLGKFAYYLATSGELHRVRPWAVLSTVGFLAAILAAVGLIPVADRCRVEGVVEPARLAFVHAEADGFVEEIHRMSGEQVAPNDALLTASSPALSARHAQLLARRAGLAARRHLARTQDTATTQALSAQIEALDEQITGVEEELRSLTLRAPTGGQWIAPDIERTRGSYLRRGDRVGLVASAADLIVRATATQDVAGPLYELYKQTDADRSAELSVELRVKGGPGSEFTGRLVKILPAGQDQLPSAALGYRAGGSIETAPDDRRGTKTAQQFFEIRVEPHDSTRLLSGQRVIVRADLPRSPLAVQWWRAALRLFQRRFQI